MIDTKATFKTLFENASLNPKAVFITGAICGARVESIENELTRKVRYLDKLVDELAKGRKMEKILRQYIKKNKNPAGLWPAGLNIRESTPLILRKFWLHA